MNITAPHNRTPQFSNRYFHSALFLLVFLVLLASPAYAAKVLIIGDTQFALVADVVSEIQLGLRTQSKEYATSEIKGRLGAVVEREAAQIVVALGMDALSEAMRLPPSVAVVYGLVVVPPKNGRANITGVYMSPPVNEYLTAIRKYFPAIARISVVGSPSMVKKLFTNESAHIDAYHVTSSSELVNTVNRLKDARSLLLLPDTSLLTAQVMANIYLFSFRNNIPLLGISEANVKQGSLFALVFDPKAVSRQIAEKVQAVLSGSDAGELSSSPPRRYNLYVNSNTARKMGIAIPDEMLIKAKKIYQ